MNTENTQQADPIIADDEAYGPAQDAHAEEVDGKVELAGAPLEVIDPASGEVLELRTLDTNDLARAVKRVDEHIVAVADFRRALIEEAVRRLDGRNKRKALVGPYELETNAPTTVEYREDVLRAELERVIADNDDVDEAILEDLWPTPAPPPPPAPRLDKRELNKLKADPRFAPAIAAASVRVNNNRTLKVREADHGR